jgi:DNA-binding transcriptional LysR family regulator
VSLTKAGTRLLDYSERIAHLVEDARRATVDDLNLGSTLAIGAMETTAAVRLSPVLTEFTRGHPNVDLVLETGTTRELINRVISRNLEGAFVAGPVAHPELTEENILFEELVLIAAAGVGKREVFGRDQREHPKAIAFRAGCAYRQRLESLMIKRGITSPRTLELGTLDGIMGCVAAGLGISLLPRATVKTVLRGNAVSIHPLARSEARVATVFVTRRDAYQSKALQRFLESARKYHSPGRGRNGPRPRAGSSSAVERR